MPGKISSVPRTQNMGTLAMQGAAVHERPLVACTVTRCSPSRTGQEAVQFSNGRGVAALDVMVCQAIVPRTRSHEHVTGLEQQGLLQRETSSIYCQRRPDQPLTSPELTRTCCTRVPSSLNSSSSTTPSNTREALSFNKCCNETLLHRINVNQRYRPSLLEVPPVGQLF